MLIIILFTLASIYAIARILNDKSKKIIITDQGIEYCFTNPGVGLISWEDITIVNTKKIYGQKMLAIYVKNPDEYLTKLPSKKRRSLKKNQKIAGTPFIIPIYLFHTNSKKLHASIDQAVKEWKATIRSDKLLMINFNLY